MAVASVTRETISLEFEQIFQQHHDLVYRTAYGVTGSVQDAEDVSQTVFLKVLRREVSLNAMKNPAGYLYRAAVNVSLTIVRSRARRVVADVEALAALQPATAVPSEAEEQHRRLYEAIAELPAKAAEILILRYQHNFTDVEIAKMLGTSRGVIAVTLYRARARLKRLLVASTGGHNERET